jgi:hypothetical protein
MLCSVRDRGLAAIARLRGLQSLNAAGCRGIGDAGVAALSTCDTLGTLCLANTKVRVMLSASVPGEVLRSRRCHQAVGASRTDTALTACARCQATGCGH